MNLPPPVPLPGDVGDRLSITGSRRLGQDVNVEGGEVGPALRLPAGEEETSAVQQQRPQLLPLLHAGVPGDDDRRRRGGGLKSLVHGADWRKVTPESPVQRSSPVQGATYTVEKALLTGHCTEPDKLVSCGHIFLTFD